MTEVCRRLCGCEVVQEIKMARPSGLFYEIRSSRELRLFRPEESGGHRAQLATSTLSGHLTDVFKGDMQQMLRQPTLDDNSCSILSRVTQRRLT
jgi:hypothetical protein